MGPRRGRTGPGGRTPGRRRAVVTRIAAVIVGVIVAMGAGAGMTLGASAAKPPRHQATSIIAPRSQLVLGAVARFRVMTPRDVKSFSARLGGRDVSSSFRRVAPNQYLGRVRWSGLVAPGATSLVVVATRRSGRRSADARTFLLGHRARGYLNVHGLSGRGFRSGSQVTVSLSRPAAFFSATLNGRKVTRLFAAVTRRGRQQLVARLAGDDGLHFGPNQLQIAAASATGGGGSLVRVLRVSRSRPLASAGPDARTVAGTTVILNAGRTVASGASERLRYRWTLVSKPLRSRARIINPASVRARLRTDRPGYYRVKMTVTEIARGPGATASPPGSDVADVSATLNARPIGVPVSVGANGITYNGQLYPFGQASVIALVLDRATLTTVAGDPINLGTNAATAIHTLAGYGNSYFVVLATKPGVNLGIGAPWNFVLAEIGGAGDFYGSALVEATRLGAGGWSAVGIPGAASGAFAYIPTGGAMFNTGAQLNGHFEYVATSLQSGYSFVNGNYTTFDTSVTSTPTTNTMLVGGVDYTSTPLPSGCTGGLHLLILAARDLQGTFEQTVPTNCTNPSVAQQALQTLDNELHNQPPEYTTQGRHLLFLQTIGAPWSSDSGVEQARYRVGIDLSGLAVNTGNGAQSSLNFGGTAGVFDTATGAYGLAGFDGFSEPGSIASHGIEASASLTNGVGAASGLLRRDDQSDYEPITGGDAQAPTPTDPSGVPEAMQMPAIANQAPTPWPTDSMAGSAQILDYIATKVLAGPSSGILSPSPFAHPSVGGACYLPAMPDVRSEYCDLGLVQSSDWSTAIADLQRVEKAVPAQFAADGDWTQIVEQLVTEMGAVSSVFSYVTATQNDLTDVQTGIQVTLEQVVAQVDNILKPPPSPISSGAPSFWSDVAGDIASLFASAQDIFSVGEAKYLTGLGGIGYLIGDLLDAPSGQPQLETMISQKDVANLATELYTRYQSMIPALGQFANLVVSDWGKLQAFAASRLGNFGENDENAFDLGISLAAARFAWTQLLPTVYNLDQTFNGGGPNPNTPPGADQFECYAGTSEPETYRPFGPHDQNGPASAALQNVIPIPSQSANGYPDTAQTYVLAGPGDPSTGSQRFNENLLTYPILPPASVTNTLFNAAAGQVGSITSLGLYPAWFYERTFTSPRFINCYPPG